MDYHIPSNTEEILALQNSSLDEKVVASAIAGVVQIARQQGQSLDRLIDSILKDDLVLDVERRKWLSKMIIQAWHILPPKNNDSL